MKQKYVGVISEKDKRYADLCLNYKVIKNYRV